MKIGVIFFHSNLTYPKKWIDDCVNSIFHQTYQDFKVFELDYGDTSVINQYYPGHAQWYKTNRIPNHSEAQNWILNKAFETCEVVFNTNMDDFYRNDRIEKQLPFMEEYDIVSSNMVHINEQNTVVEHILLSDKDLEHNFTVEHNIIAHPVCCYSKRFWTAKGNPGFQFSNFPRDDFELWKWAKSQGFKFYIIPESLLYYRRHGAQVSKPDNAKRLRENDTPNNS